MKRILLLSICFLLNTSFYITKQYYFLTSNRLYCKNEIKHGLTRYDLSQKQSQIIQEIFELAEINEVDPILVLSIAWTESHLNHSAISKVGALGVMQVMPMTAIEVLKIKKEHISLIENELLKNSRFNINTGIQYIKYLMNRFNSNKHVIVAYNMGPTWTYRRLRNKKSVGVKNLYLDKVSKIYLKLHKNALNSNVSFSRKINGSLSYIHLTH